VVTDEEGYYWNMLVDPLKGPERLVPPVAAFLPAGYLALRAPEAKITALSLSSFHTTLHTAKHFCLGTSQYVLRRISQFCKRLQNSILAYLLAYLSFKVGSFLARSLIMEMLLTL
jgi:hypothetical protein